MPTNMPCVTRRGRSLHPDCYDRLGRKIGLELERVQRPLKLKPDDSRAKKQLTLRICEKEQQEAMRQQARSCGFQLSAGVGLKSLTRQRPLPPGTTSPPLSRPLPRPYQKPLRRSGTGGEATYFHVLGQPWETRGFAELTKDEVERMKAAKPLSPEELKAEHERLQEEEQQNKEEAERVRVCYWEMDEARREREQELQRQLDAEVDGDDEKASEARKQMVMHKQLAARHLDDERVQTAIRAIGAAKCSAMWTSQIEERALMERLQEERDVEQARKDTAFNDSKWGSVEEQEQRALDKRQAFGDAVRQQMADRRQLRHLAEEQRREESRQVADAYTEYKRYQVDQMHATGERKLHYRKELFHYIQLHRDFNRLLCQQEQRDEIRANTYVINKEKQRLEQRQLKADIEADKERRRDALFVLQQKILDAKDNREEMRLLAEHERLERKYRLLERQAAENRRTLVEDLRNGNRKAMDEIQKLKACYYSQRQREMDEVKEERVRYEKQRQVELQQKIGRKINLYQGVTAQMEEHERARRREIERDRMESEKNRALEEQRQKEIDMVISVKLDELGKKRCLPQNALQSLTGRVANSGNKKLSNFFKP